MIRLQRIHFIGIGGTGMSGIAEILLTLGYRVSGSDVKSSPVTDRLEKLGARISIGHRFDNVGEVDAVVVSTAISRENPEVRVARDRGIPVVPRAEMLAELMRLKYGIAIAGTHGKTTTTSMTAMVLTEGGLDPTVIIGGRLEQLGSGAKRGAGDYFVAEADESDGSFLKLSPTVSVVTNIDDDHLDYYGDMGKLTSTFHEFMNRVPFYGFGVICADDPRLRGLVAMSSRRMVTYGIGSDADVRADNIEMTATGSTYSLFRKTENLGRVTLAVFGRHNVANSLAAATVGLELGMAPDKVIAGLGQFTGVDRRMQAIGEGNAADGGTWRVFDDYGHHPTELTATIAAARQLSGKGRVIVFFQPHRFSRTALLYDKFATALSAADGVYLLPVYSAGEAPREGVTTQLIEDSLVLKGYTNFRSLAPQDALADVVGELRDGDVVLTMGAGDVTYLGAKLVEASGASSRIAAAGCGVSA
ncbi:MAG: UDP-N-acetylmuramate--L-alanine ligase [Candidatus Hydrogenedentota bacterium]